MSSALSPSNPNTTTSRWGLYVSIVLIGANLRAPITSLGPVLPDIQRALHLGGLGAEAAGTDGKHLQFNAQLATNHFHQLGLAAL